MATTEKGMIKVKVAQSERINDNPFTMDDVMEILRERQESEDFKHQQDELEKKKQLLARAEANSDKKAKVCAASVADILGFDPRKKIESKAESHSIDDVPAKFKKYYKILLELKSKCKSGVCKLANANLNISAGEKKDTKPGSDPDVDSFDTHFALSLLSNEQEALMEIDAAIARIFSGTYGICEITGKPIESARLAAVPFTRFSLEGKMQQEKKSKTVRERGGDGSIFAAEIDDDTPQDYGEDYEE